MIPLGQPLLVPERSEGHRDQRLTIFTIITGKRNLTFESNFDLAQGCPLDRAVNVLDAMDGSMPPRLGSFTIFLFK